MISIKSVINISNIGFHKYTTIIRDFTSNYSEIIASEISLTKKEIALTYNEPFFNIEKIIDSMGDLRYIVI